MRKRMRACAALHACQRPNQSHRERQSNGQREKKKQKKNKKKKKKKKKKKNNNNCNRTHLNHALAEGAVAVGANRKQPPRPRQKHRVDCLRAIVQSNLSRLGKEGERREEGQLLFSAYAQRRRLQPPPHHHDRILRWRWSRRRPVP